MTWWYVVLHLAGEPIPRTLQYPTEGTCRAAIAVVDPDDWRGWLPGRRRLAQEAANAAPRGQRAVVYFESGPGHRDGYALWVDALGRIEHSMPLREQGVAVVVGEVLSDCLSGRGVP